MWRFLPLLVANLGRRRLRTAFTLGSIVVAFLLYGLLSAVNEAFSIGVELAGQNRLMTIHKVSLIQPLPASHAGRIRGVEGVRYVSPMTWLGGTYQDDRNVIQAFPVDPETFLAIYPEILVSPELLARWRAERRAVLVGSDLARRFGWKPGDIVSLRTNIWPRADGGNVWEFQIAGTYALRNDIGDKTSMYFRHDYFTESLAEGAKGLVGWYVIAVDDPAAAPEVARRIDALFANSRYETRTSSEKAFAQGFANQIGNIGAILTAVMTAVFFTMLLVTANTMAQSVRERTNELAVLKTLGFTNTGVVAMVLGEAVLLTAIGGAAGIGLAALAVAALAGAIAQYLPVFEISPAIWLKALLLILALGIAAGVAPAWRALRLRIAAALRQA
jgi:putative ABC transport system permease protein